MPKTPLTLTITTLHSLQLRLRLRSQRKEYENAAEACMRAELTCEKAASETMDPVAKANPRKRKRSTLIPIQTQSPLLRLPGEIRNRIYEYACAEIRPLHVYGHNQYASIEVQAQRLHNFNRLKHVCRQLRHETLIMGLTWNQAAYWHSRYQDAHWHFTSLPHEIPLSTAIKIIQYYDRFRSVWPIPGCDIDFCEHNPQSELLLLTSLLRLGIGCRGLLVHGAALQLLWRGRQLPFVVDSSFATEVDRVVQRLTVEDIGSFAEGHRRPSNLKIFPIDDFDEEELRYSYLRKRKGFENWVVQIREWYEHGI